MATIKSYSDLQQSRKLAEILPLESADMYWLNKHTDLTETKYEVFVIDKSNKHIDFFNSYAVAIDNNEIIPCWSLAALLNAYQGNIVMYKQQDTNKYRVATKYIGTYATSDNPIDAVFEMILRLHKLKKL